MFRYEVTLWCGCTIAWTSKLPLSLDLLSLNIRTAAREAGQSGMLPCVVHGWSGPEMKSVVGRRIPEDEP